MFKTVKNKFVLFFVLFIVVTVTVPVTFLVYQFRQNFDQRSSIMLKTTTDIVLAGIESNMMSKDHSGIQKVIENISENKNVVHVRMFNKAGEILYASDTTEVGRYLNDVAPGHIDFEDEQLSNGSIDRQDGKVFRITQPIMNSEKCRSCHNQKGALAYLDIDTDLTDAEVKFFTGSVHIIFLAILIVLVMVTGSYALFNYFINKPLALFFNAIDEVEKGNLDARLPARNPDEFGILQEHFNKMVARLQSSKAQIEQLNFDQLQNADKLVTLGELTGEMAHEINNHSAIILSRTDFLRLESESIAGLQKYKEDLDVIMNQINSISKITKNILRHGKKRKESFRRIDLTQLVDNSMQILDPLLSKRRVVYEKNFEAENSIIYADPFQIEQLLTNLAVNALDAMEYGGTLSVTVKQNNGSLELSISDTGKGINQEEMKKIFSPFYTTKTEDKGTGLGLYIVMNICKNHNAEITCESKTGEGTSFTVLFRVEE